MSVPRGLGCVVRASLACGREHTARRLERPSDESTSGTKKRLVTYTECEQLLVSGTKTQYERKLASVKGDAPPKRRQARGQQRIQLLLDVAEQLFAEFGFEATTTNAIAARAGMSPGSLYQFFPNKDAIAEALADRFVERLRATEAIFGPEIEFLPLDDLINHIVDPLGTLHVSQLGFQAPSSGSHVS